MLSFVWLTTQYLADSIGIDENQFRFTLSLVLSIPISYIFRFVKSPIAREWMSLLFGLLFLFFSFLRETWFLIAFAAASYLLLLILPRISSRPGALLFFSSMSLLSLSHLWRMYSNYLSDDIDFSAPMMLLVLKVIEFGYYFFDNKSSVLSPLSFFSYSFCFLGALCGPVYSWEEFQVFIHRQNQHSKPYPSCLSAFSLKALFAIISSAGFALSCIHMFSREYLLTEDFHSHFLVRKVIHVIIIVTLFRCKYYVVWFLSEGSFVLSGISYRLQRKDGKQEHSWDGILSVRPFAVEVPDSLKNAVSSWNVSVSAWLKKNVYLRNKDWTRFERNMATFVTSAVWHGFYPGYYFFFLAGPIYTDVSGLLRMKIRPLCRRTDPSAPYYLHLLYDVVGTVILSVGLSFASSSFVLLDVSSILKVWGWMYYFPYITVLVLWVVLHLSDLLPKRIGKQKAL